MRRGLIIRLVGRLLVPRLGAHLATRMLLLAFVAVQLDAMVDWSSVSALLAALRPWQAALLWAGVGAGWAVESREALRRAALHPSLEVLWRQPLTAGDWAWGLAGPLALASLPLATAGLLVGPAHALGIGALGALASFAAALGHHSGIAALVAIAVTAAIGQAVPVLRVPLAVAAVPLAALAIGRLALMARPVGPPATRSVTIVARGPLTALALRDLLCLWRSERALAIGCLLVSAPAWGVQSAAQVNGPLHGPSAALAALIVLGALAPVGAAATAALAFRLGPHLDPPELPVSPAGRATALVGVGTALVAPVALGVLAAGPGSAAYPRVALLTVALAAGAVLSSVSPRDVAARAHGTGRWLWWLLACVTLAAAPPPWGPLSSAALALAAWSATSLLLRRRRRCPPV